MVVRLGVDQRIWSLKPNYLRISPPLPVNECCVTLGKPPTISEFEFVLLEKQR